MTVLLRLLAGLPLAWLHALGACIGWTVYLLSPRYAARLRENLSRSQLWRAESDYRKLLNRSIAEAGKAALEVFAIWFRPLDRVRELIACDTPTVFLDELEAKGRGIIYLTPHQGCFEATGPWLSRRGPLTALYRPPKITAVQSYIEAGRERGALRLAPANLGGVRSLLKALRRGESIIILPDQAPGTGEGVWVDFFGRPAYTMTLVGRLVEASGAPVGRRAARRLLRGAGYSIHLQPVAADLRGDAGPRNLNAAVEDIVKLMPEQYFWSYNRYKVPAGAAPPETNTLDPDRRTQC